MKIIVNPHKCEIDRTPVNEKEINVTKVEFEFTDEITDEFVKEAYFTLKGNSYKQIIVNNECDIPGEVLAEQGTLEIGVVAFIVENETTIKRYNPSPVYIETWVGSLKNAQNTEPITPSDKEQIEQAITDLENNKQDLLVDGENIKTINNESLLGSGNLEVITDLSDYYTKSEIDSMIGDIDTALDTINGEVI